MAAAEQVQVKVKDGLAGATAAIEHRAIAGEEIALFGQFGGNELQFAEEGLICFRSIVQRREMLARANQNVRGRLRGDVLKRKDIVIFINNLGGDFLCADFAEQAVLVHPLTP